LKSITAKILPKSMTAKITPKAAEPAAGVVKPTIKKETVRIEVPTGPRGVPQATVRIQPAPPPARPPEAVVRTLVPAPVPVLTDTEPETGDEEGVAHDPLLLYASYGVLAFALINFGLQLATYLAR
jgi:hypothetical protein